VKAVPATAAGVEATAVMAATAAAAGVEAAPGVPATAAGAAEEEAMAAAAGERVSAGVRTTMTHIGSGRPAAR
jgi:hypothetical protein